MPKKINVRGPIVSNSTAWIYNWFGWDATSPNTISQGLEEAAGDEVIIEINSPGGVCVYGYEMYTAIMNYPGKVTAHVISAMSAATLLVCAADEALISDTGIFMIHNAQSDAEGDYRDMQMEADALREFNAGIINAYVRKTNLSREEIQNLMDNDSYMSPQTAIENGFIDGYLFGDPNAKNEPTNLAQSIVAADTPIIPEDKAKVLMKLLKEVSSEENGQKELKALMNDEGITNIGKDAEVAPVQHNDEENGVGADPIENNKEGDNKMDLQEFLSQNPEAQAEFNNRIAEARNEGVSSERTRMESLDNIASTVTPEALNEAKYGENPVDGPTLAYQAMCDGNKLATAYMKNAQQDSEESGVKDVGVGQGEDEETNNESDAMAAHVNKMKGGK